MESVVLDANIFFRIWILDPVLTLADAGIFEPLWSDEIMAEASRNLRHAWRDANQETVDAFLGQVDAAYPWARVPDWREYMQGLTLPDPDDCHVLAAAIAGSATSIVTINLADFPEDRLAVHGVRVEHPDKFLSRLFDADPEDVCSAIGTMVADKHHPPRTMAEEIAGLHRAGLHGFASRLNTATSHNQ